MADLDKLQQELTHHFKNPYDHKDHHYTIVYSNSNKDKFLISYRSKNINNNLPLLCLFTNHQMINWQLITAQHFTDNYPLYFLVASHQQIQSKKLDDFKKMLQTHNVKLTAHGALAMSIDSKKPLFKNFISFLKVLQVINQDGDNYTVANYSNGTNNLRKHFLNQLVTDQEHVKQLEQNYRKEQSKDRGQTTHHSKKLKAHGKVVAGYSSTKGTPREIRYAKERKQRAKKQAYLKAHPTLLKKIKAKRYKRAHAVHVSGEKVTTSGRFAVPHKSVVMKIKQLGGEYQTNLTQSTAYLVCDKPNHSQKYQQAKKNGVRIIPSSKLQA